MKSVSIAVLILAVCLSCVGFAVAQDDAGSGCPTEEACELWEEFKEEYGDAFTSVGWDSACDCVRGLYGYYDTDKGELVTEEEAEAFARDFLSENAELFKIDMSDIDLERIKIDKLGVWKVDFGQEYQGISVYRGEVRVIVSNRSEISNVINNFYPDINIPTEPEITREEAVEIVAAATDGATSGIDKVVLFILPPEEVEDDGLTYRLVWRTWSVKRLAYYYVDALNGEVLRVEPTAAGYGGGGAADGGAGDSKRALPFNIIITAALILIAVLALWRRKRRK